jgi:hypothetical protein
MSAFTAMFHSAPARVVAGRSSTDNRVAKAASAFEQLVQELMAQGHSEDSARAIAAAHGRDRYGAHVMAQAAQHHRSARAEQAAERRGLSKSTVNRSVMPNGRDLEKAEFSNPRAPTADTAPRDEGRQAAIAPVPGRHRCHACETAERRVCGWQPSARLGWVRYRSGGPSRVRAQRPGTRQRAARHRRLCSGA